MSVIKKILSIIICLSIIFTFGACSKNSSGNKSNSERLSIICTVFPEYDWIKNILGDKAGDVDLTLLLDSGTDLHSYQPTVNDLVTISNCDMFVYVGGESDKWVEDALANSADKDIVAVNLLESLGDAVKEEELKDGMENEEEEHDHDHGEDGEETEYDEHIWLSLKNAAALCKTLSDKIEKLDPANADTYKSNTESYIKSLEELDGQYNAVCADAKTNTLVFCDRFPFRYMVDDYSLDYYAAFAGCSAETEASFETISFLAAKVDELGLDTVFTTEGTDRKIAETVISNTKNKNQKIASLNSMQGITSEQIKNGASYLSVMTDNLTVLKDALS